jgi:Chalcone isomerase-like
MERALVAAVICAALAAPGARAAADEVKESATGVTFATERTVGGHKLMLFGTGVRKKFVVKVYAMALYGDEEEARRNFPALVARAGGKSRAALLGSDHAQTFLIWGAFTKLGVLHFVRDVGAEKIRDAFKEGLEEELSEKAAPELRKAAETFLAMFDKDLKDGSEILIRTDGDGHVRVEIAGDKKDGPSNPKLARAIWAVWLGAKPISPDMRKSLVDRIDQLGK